VSKHQCIEGTMVFVSQGDTYKHETLVLRILTQGSKNRAPGEVDMYFVPMMKHLFGPARIPDHHVLQVNHQGLTTWNTPEVAMDQLRSKQTEQSIPRKIHFIFGLSEDTEILPESFRNCVESWERLNPNYETKIWNKSKCEELIRSHFPHLESLYTQMKRAVMRVDLMKLLILFHEGGIYVDLDAMPVGDLGFDELIRQWNYPRLALVHESNIHAYEAESLNQFDIRKNEPCRPGMRIGNYFSASVPRHPLTHFILQHMTRYAPLVGQHDYDAVFATGSDAITTVYHAYGRDFVDVMVTPLDHSFVEHRRESLWKKH